MTFDNDSSKPKIGENLLIFLTSSPIVIDLVIVKGSTGPQALGTAAAAAAADASDSFCSRSLFFRFSSYKME